MLRVKGRDATELERTSLDALGLSEDDLREWVISHPESFLGEDVLVIGREVLIEDVNDGIDVLGLDPDGNLVVVELKRGALTGDVDFQGLKYASYISRWGYRDAKEQFERFTDTQWGKTIHGPDAEFTETIEEFCNEGYEFNVDQRVVLVGSSVRERIGSVALWLREKGVDAQIVQFSLYHDGDDRVYVDVRTLVPTSTDLEKFEIGRNTEASPWKVDGMAWHLSERAGEDSAPLLRALVEEFDRLPLAGPHWNQKSYVAYRHDGINRVLFRARRQYVGIEVVDFNPDAVDSGTVAEQLGLIEDDVTLDAERYHSRPSLSFKCRPTTDLETVVDVVGEILDMPVKERLADV